MTMYDALNPKCNVDEIYVSCKMRSRGDKLRRCIRMEENNLGWYANNSVKPLIDSVRATKTLENDDIVTKKEFTKTWIYEKKECGMTKRMYKEFIRKILKQQMDEKKHGNG